MAILDFKTNLKSLRYGKDRPFGGSSNQPYIQRDIDVRDSEVGRTGGPDFLLRGGTLVPRRVVNDVSRMTQMLFDLKTPNGPLFTAKQNILALTSTDSKAGFEPLTLQGRGSAVGDFLRNNVNFDLNNVYTPLSTIGQAASGVIGAHLYKQGLNPLEGPTKYLDITENKKSRVENLYNTGGLFSDGKPLYSYIGGPGSTLGIGRTGIKKGESTDYTGKDPILNYDELAIESFESGKELISISDFRQSQGGSKVKTLDYSRPEDRIEQRVNLGDPGKKLPKRTNYQEGLGEALDKLNAMPLYRGPGPTSDKTKNDFVKFRIGVIDNRKPDNKTYIHFRAFLDTLSDSYTSQWDNERLMGRGETFYRFNNFTRAVNLGWTVAAQSKQELMPMYQKLNYLASSLAPDYTDIGYMAGNLVTLTLGGWFYEQPGIITSMTLDVPQESPWEIAIPAGDGGDPENPIKSDSSVKELPHIVKVTGVQFLPIHKFVPRVQVNQYGGVTDSKVGLKGEKYGTGDVSKFGKERYLALANGEGAKYNNYDS